MAGRATLLVVLLLVATCAWANPISRDNRQATSEAPQGPAVSVSTQSPSVAKNETSSRDAPKPAQSSAVAAEKEETESPVTEAVDSLIKETVVSAPVEAAEKVAVAAAVEETKEDSPVTEKEEAEKTAFPAEVEKTNEKSPVSKKVEAEKVAISAEVEEAKEESPVTEKGEAEKVAVPAEVEKANEKSPVSKKVEAEKVAVSAKVEEAKEESTVSEKVEVKKVEVAAEKESTIVEKADVIEQSETIISEEVTTSAPINEVKVVERASPSSPQEPEIAEEVTTVSPAADEEIIEERLRSSQVESDALEKTEKSKIKVESSKLEEKETKPLQDAAPIVEKSIDGAKTRDEEQSPATEAVPAAAADKVKVERIPVDDVAAAFEEETVVAEAEIEATTVFEEEGDEKVEATTPFDDSSDRKDATEDPSDKIAAESSGIEIVTAISVESEDGSFRQGDIDITEAPEEEDISSTTAIPHSEQDIDAEIRGDDETTVEPSTETPIDRMDSSTDIIFVDVTTEQSEETTEELIQAESLLRKIEVEEDAATDAPEAAKEESDSIDRRDDGAQAITTEATLEETTVIGSPQSFDDAAQIKVVEIKESSKPVESIVPADSAPIEIVEITEKPQLLAKDKAEEIAQALNEKKSPALEQEIFQTTEIIPGEEEATTIESQSPAIRDKQEKPSSSGSEQDQEPEEEEEKPNSSKIQPAPAEDYWLSMKAEGNKSALVPAKPAESSSNADEVAVEAVEEAKDVDVNIRGGDNLTSTVVAAPSAVVTPASVVAPAAAVAQESSIDDEIAKVAQKYGLQSVGKVTTEQKPVEQVASDTQVVVSDADVPKADSIYLGNESKKSDFQESNDLQRRHSFGDKVVRFVRSFL